MKQIYNPYLPLTEYVPDGEPHVFGDRIYIYGSHDRAGGTRYCEENYVVYSAPVNDLKNWRYEGVSYRKEQDPSNPDGMLDLWAPDVVQGADGRYYLYYCLNFRPEIGVAVSKSPAGPFEFYGHVKYAEDIRHGKKLEENFPFDPGVFVDDDKRVWLYYGFAVVLPTEDDLRIRMQGMPEEMVQATLDATKDFHPSEGGYVVELSSDMKTMIGEPKLCLPGAKLAKGTEFEGHAFFEASSMRKFNGRYYYIYSSELSHELCYAVSGRPDCDFSYGGTIISNGDVGFQGQTKPTNMIGNNHGSVEKVGNDYYVFYHRQTHGSECSRQGCAEKVTLSENGKINQVEMTSCGLNQGALIGKGIYPAAIACHLTPEETIRKTNVGEPPRENYPRIMQEADKVFIANLRNGSCFGFKYFEMSKTDKISITIRGDFIGEIIVSDRPDGQSMLGTIEINIHRETWEKLEICIPNPLHGRMPLYFIQKGIGQMDVLEIAF